MCFRRCSSLTSISFPSSLQTIGENAFDSCLNLNSITWNRWTGSFSSLASDAFSGVCPDGGTVTVTNPSTYDTDELLQYLLNNGGLPETWAKDASPILPEEVYKFSDDGKTLLGFQDAFLNDSASPIYKDNFQNCDTIQIPARVTSIADNAFYANTRSTIPSFITNLTFAKNSNCISLGERAFNIWQTLEQVNFSNCTSLSKINYLCFQGSKITSIDLSKCTNLSEIGRSAFYLCESLTSVIFPSSLQKIDHQVFGVTPLRSITWDAWNGNTTLGTYSFDDIRQVDGTVTVTNPIDEAHNSQALLDYLKQNGRLPEGWHI